MRPAPLCRQGAARGPAAPGAARRARLTRPARSAGAAAGADKGGQAGGGAAAERRWRQQSFPAIAAQQRCHRRRIAGQLLALAPNRAADGEAESPRGGGAGTAAAGGRDAAGARRTRPQPGPPQLGERGPRPAAPVPVSSRSGAAGSLIRRSRRRTRSLGTVPGREHSRTAPARRHFEYFPVHLVPQAEIKV